MYYVRSYYHVMRRLSLTESVNGRLAIIFLVSRYLKHKRAPNPATTTLNKARHTDYHKLRGISNVTLGRSVGIPAKWEM